MATKPRKKPSKKPSMKSGLTKSTKKGAPNKKHSKVDAKSKKKKSAKGKTKAATTKKATTKSTLSDLLEPLKSLSGDEVRKLAAALTDLDSKSTIESLQRNRDVEVGNIQRLGDQATGNVSSYYRSLAQAEAGNLGRSQAIAQRANEDQAATGATTQQNIAQAGQSATAALSQPSSAREELQTMIAAQSGRAAREQQALAGATGTQGQNYAGLLQAMAQSNQNRGGQSVSNIAKQALGGVQKTQMGYGEDIRKAIGDRSGEYLKNAIDLRAAEREYSLGQAAVGQKQQYQQFAQQQQKTSGKQAAKSRQGQKKLAGIYNRNKMKQTAASSASQQALAASYAANTAAQQAGSSALIAQGQAGSGGGSNVLKDPYKGVKRATDLLHATKGSTPKSAIAHRRAAIGMLVKNGIDPKAARVAVKRYTKPRRTRVAASTSAASGGLPYGQQASGSVKKYKKK